MPAPSKETARANLEYLMNKHASIRDYNWPYTDTKEAGQREQEPMAGMRIKSERRDCCR